MNLSKLHLEIVVLNGQESEEAIHETILNLVCDELLGPNERLLLNLDPTRKLSYPALLHRHQTA